MLRLTLDLIPHGDKSKRRTLATCEIVNDGMASDGSGDSPVGSYRTTLKAGRSVLRGGVSNWPRKSLDAVALAAVALLEFAGRDRR